MQGANELRTEGKVEGMSLKDLHVGGWYRCREERMLGNVVGRVLGENTYPFAVVLYRDGKYHDVVSMTVGGRITDPDEHSFDLVEFLQDCTGPEWKPQKWRKARPEDAIAKKECKVTGVSLTFPAVLSGVRFGLNNDVRFYVYEGNGFLWYDSDFVEVLDD